MLCLLTPGPVTAAIIMLLMLLQGITELVGLKTKAS